MTRCRRRAFNLLSRRLLVVCSDRYQNNTAHNPHVAELTKLINAIGQPSRAMTNLFLISFHAHLVFIYLSQMSTVRYSCYTCYCFHSNQSELRVVTWLRQQLLNGHWGTFCLFRGNTASSVSSAVLFQLLLLMTNKNSSIKKKW